MTRIRMTAATLSGLAFAGLLAACGGGGGSSSSPTAQPLEPEPTVSFTRDNPSGEDLLDHWNQPSPAQAALGLTTGNVDPGGIAALLNDADPRREDSRALMRNADPARMETIGHDNGITYGQWRDGPAGTLNMQLDWSQAPGLSAARRGDFERATKAWTYRLNEDFPARQVPAHKDYTYLLFSYDEPQIADDMLIAVELDTWDGSDSANGTYYEWSERNGDLEAWFGAIQMSPEEMQRYHTDFRYYMLVITHELGHTLPTNPIYDEQYGLWPDMGPYEQYLDIANATFTGPHATAANGGEPVPYQWLDGEGQLVAPGTPGATVDFTHIGPCGAIMSYAYCDEDNILVKPTELDFAILRDLGYDLLSASEAAEPEVYGYGAWAEYSAWGAGVERVIDYQGSGGSLRITDTLSAHVDAFGTVPATTFADAHAGMTGQATWNGALLGVDVGRSMLPPVFGDASLTVDLADLDGNVTFSRLTTAVGGELHDFRRTRLEYDVTVRANGFTSANDTLNGSFYGPAHEEMAGVLDDRSSAVNLIGSFGGTR